MSIDTGYPHIEKREGQPARLKRVPRTRVAMIVMDYLFDGMSVDTMCEQHPYLSPAEAHSAMAYYFDHKDEIEEEIQKEVEEVERDYANAPPSPLAMRLRAQGLLK